MYVARRCRFHHIGLLLVVALGTHCASAAGKAPAAQPTTVLAANQTATRGKQLSVAEWFEKYGQIRIDAQMNLKEKLCAKRMLDQICEQPKKEPNADERAEARQLAVSLASRYDVACRALQQLGSPAETNALQRGYLNYFGSARQLFRDFVKYEGLISTNDATRQLLVDRKQRLEQLDSVNKSLDKSLRDRYKIDGFKG